MNNKFKLSNIVANDDGSSYHKVSYFAKENGKITIKTCITPTNISEGNPNIQWGSKTNIASIFDINGKIFTCDENTAGYDVRSRQDHQWSDGNIAMNQYALQKAGFGGKYVNLATGVPVEMFFNGPNGTKDEELINKKESAFVEAQIKNKTDTKGNPTELDEGKLVTILSNTVIPEAIGAYMDLTINNDGTDGKVYERDVLIIDMGSYTTDIAVVGPGGLIRKEFTKTLEDHGFLNIYDEFRTLCSQKKLGPKRIPNKFIEEAFKTNKIEYLNASVDVEEVVFLVQEKCITPIILEIKRLLGDDINFLSAIIGVGGGAELIRDFFTGLTDVIDIPENPQFANSRGMLKTLAYAAGVGEVEDDL